MPSHAWRCSWGALQAFMKGELPLNMPLPPSDSAAAHQPPLSPRRQQEVVSPVTPTLPLQVGTLCPGKPEQPGLEGETECSEAEIGQGLQEAGSLQPLSPKAFARQRQTVTEPSTC